MSIINQQVKQVVSDFPYYLGDCLIVEVTEFKELNQSFIIYRIEVIVKSEVRYLDLITDADDKFLGLGANTRTKDFGYNYSHIICESYAIQKYLEEAY